MDLGKSLISEYNYIPYIFYFLGMDGIQIGNDRNAIFTETPKLAETET